MQKAVIWVLVALILGASLVTVELPALGESKEILRLLNEANQNFTYKSKPIHPGLVQEFLSWISDRGLPTTISVDIAAPHRNEYFEDAVKIKENGYILLSEEKEYFYYKWLGRLNNGLHVLETGEGSIEGSGIFKDVYFVKFSIGQGLTDKGDPYSQLLMTTVRNHVLGDRYDGEVSVLPGQNKVIIGKSKHNTKAIVLEFN